jgi:hypothetical protein
MLLAARVAEEAPEGIARPLARAAVAVGAPARVKVCTFLVVGEYLVGA